MTVVNATPPVVSDTTPQVGQTITTTDGTWTYSLDYLTYTYRWLRCDSAGANCVAIGGATTPSYQVVSADVGHKLRSEVTATEHTSTGSQTPNPPSGSITTISNVAIALNVANDAPTTYQDYDISNTGDSAIILGGTFGSVTTFRRFRLRNIAGPTHPGYPGYACHGIYCKRNNVLIEDFDVEMDKGDGLTLRRSGITVNRFRSISTVDFACSYFEEDPLGGTVTMQNGTGQSNGGYFMWTGSNPDPGPGIVVQTTIHQRFVFENIDYSGGSIWIGRDPNEIGYDGPGVQFINCRINGVQITAGNAPSLVQNYPIISVS
jgi:hypothetical protein